MLRKKGSTETTGRLDQWASMDTVTKRKTGRAINLYLHPDDEERIGELRAYISAAGHRVSDSQIVKAALFVAKTDPRFKNAWDEVRARDQRYKA